MRPSAFDFLFRRKAVYLQRAAEPPPEDTAHFVWRQGIRVNLVRSARAKRYLLRLQPDGAARLVIPRRGSRAEALRFLERSREWLRRRHAQWLAHQATRRAWLDGATFLFRGEPVRLRVTVDLFGTTLAFAGEVLREIPPAADYRSAIQARLRTIAERELPVRTRELAREHGIAIRRISVRAQKTRWGSCSSRGTISLNWRLIQAPPFVQDYLIIHELMHCRQMNHSARYWKLVAEAFPRWCEAESWLKQTRLDSLG